MKIARKQMKADVPSVAMGDIAFNLLIFFVILARAQDDSHLQWQPARAQHLEAAGQSKVSVVIDNENKLHLNGREIGVAQLAGEIEKALGDLPVGPAHRAAQVHKDATALYYEPVIEAVSEAGGDFPRARRREVSPCPSQPSDKPTTRGSLPLPRDVRVIHCQRLGIAGRAARFLGGLHGKSPQEVIGIVSSSLLVQSMILAVVATAVLLAVFTVGPYFGLRPAERKAKRREAGRRRGGVAAAQRRLAGTCDAGQRRAGCRQSGVKAMGLDETKVGRSRRRTRSTIRSSTTCSISWSTGE